MADKTFGVKVSEDLYEKVKGMIDYSGDSAKDWFEKIVAISELQSVKHSAPDFNQDLNELEMHTTRMYELVSNMIQRSIYMKDHAVKDVADKLEQKELIIGEYQEKIKKVTDELTLAQETTKKAEDEKEELQNQMNQLQSTYENNQLLIKEYKEKNDTLSGLVTKYQNFAEENERLKGQFSNEKERLLSQVKEISGQCEEQLNENSKLKEQLQSLKDTHALEIERINEKKEYEKDKALLAVEKDYQQRLIQVNEEYTEKIQKAYVEINSMQKEINTKGKQKKNKK